MQRFGLVTLRLNLIRELVVMHPYDRKIDEEAFIEMKKSNIWKIQYDKFLKLISPSFTAVEDPEDMDAIAARTHLIIITEFGVYYRVASTSKDPVDFITWVEGEPKDLLSPTQVSVFRQYKLNPDKHQPPPFYHADCVWSQEMLRRLLHGEPLPSTSAWTVRHPRSLFGNAPLDSYKLLM